MVRTLALRIFSAGSRRKAAVRICHTFLVDRCLIRCKRPLSSLPSVWNYPALHATFLIVQPRQSLGCLFFSFRQTLCYGSCAAAAAVQLNRLLTSSCCSRRGHNIHAAYMSVCITQVPFALSLSLGLLLFPRFDLPGESDPPCHLQRPD
jgi:hypothetical protein